MATETAAVTTTLEQDEASLQTLANQLQAAAAEGEMSKVVAISTDYARVEKALMKRRLEESSEEIKAMENTLVAGIGMLVNNTDYEKVTGQPITTVIWAITEEDGVKTPQVLINPKRRTSTVSGGTRKQTSGIQVSRTVNGVVETLTVKEVIQKYASDEVKALKLFEKNAWGMLFPKVNAGLEPKFEEPEAQVEPVADADTNEIGANSEGEPPATE